MREPFWGWQETWLWRGSQESMGMTPARTWAVEEWVPELALSRSQTDDYLDYHHRTFDLGQMETETETHIEALDGAPKVQLKSGRRENMSKEVRTTRGSPTETVCLS